MTFVDDLALVEVFLLLVAAVLAYSGVRVWIAIRANQPDSLRRILKGTAVPIGLVGIVTLILALWGEMTWPFPSFMAGYNIFFFDPMMLMGFVLTAYAISAFLDLRLQYVGVFAMVAGGVTVFYGYTGYTASPAFTKDPFDTLLLYVGFGVAGILALPAAVIVDYYQSAVDHSRAIWQSSKPSLLLNARGFGSRAVQPVGAGGATGESSSVEKVFHFPKALQLVVLLFPVFVALAGIAAFWYFGVTLPGHLGSGPANAP